MHEHGETSTLPEQQTGTTYLLIGNPNVGKSLLFHHLTGRYVTVSNYTGTTVGITSGRGKDGKSLVVDAPGIRSLLPTSEDETVTRNLLLDHPEARVIVVADAKHLRRALVLLGQLALMGHRMVLALNLWDEAQDRGVHIDVNALEKKLGIPVIPTVALDGTGIDRLIQSLDYAAQPQFSVTWTPDVAAWFRTFRARVDHPAADYLLFAFLAGDAGAEEHLARLLPEPTLNELQQARHALRNRIPEPLAAWLLTQIGRTANRWLKDVLHTPSVSRHSLTWSERLDRWMLHPVAGYGVLAVVLLAIYLFVGLFGAGVLVDWLENGLFNRWLNPALTHLFSASVFPQWFTDFLVGPYGLFTMALTYGIAIIFPIVLTFFLAFGFLEDSGYLPRLAAFMDRAFRSIGLNGKAVLPMVLGLGCVTMATVTTRTLETRRERLLVTLLLALGVPCSAQLGVVMAMVAQLSWVAFVIWGGMITFHLFLVGWIAARVVKGERSPLILELPPLRWPSASNIFWKTLARLEWYLKEVLPVFVLGTSLLFLMDRTGLLGWIERLFAPVVVHILGLPAQAAQGFIMGFLRRDYGAAGFLMLQDQGLLTPAQVLVSVVTITLFVPCIANFLVMIREQGWKRAFGMLGVIIPYAIFAGWLTRVLLTGWAL